MFEELSEVGKMVFALLVGLGVIAMILGIGGYIGYLMTNNTDTVNAWLSPVQSVYGQISNIGPILLAAIAIFAGIGYMVKQFTGERGKG